MILAWKNLIFGKVNHLTSYLLKKCFWYRKPHTLCISVLSIGGRLIFLSFLHHRWSSVGEETKLEQKQKLKTQIEVTNHDFSYLIDLKNLIKIKPRYFNRNYFKINICFCLIYVIPPLLSTPLNIHILNLHQVRRSISITIKLQNLP